MVDTPNPQPFTFEQPSLSDPSAISFEDMPKQSVDEGVATVRAAKAKYGLGDEAPDIESLRNMIYSGDEGNLRRNTAAQEDIAFRQSKIQILKELTQNRDTPLTPDESLDILALSQADLTADPDTILEKKYAQKYMQDFVQRSNSMFKAPTVDQDQAGVEQDIASQVLMRGEYARTVAEDLRQRQGQEGWGSYLVDLGLSMGAPLYSNVRQRGAVEGSGADALLTGTNVQQQIAYLYTLPEKEFKQEFTAAVNKIADHSITQAIDFANAVQQHTTTDTFLANVFDLADASGIASGVAGAGKGVVRAIARGTKNLGEVAGSVVEADLKAGATKVAPGPQTAASEAPRGSVSPSSQAGEVDPTPRDIRQAFADVLKAQSTPNPEVDTILNGSGQTETAAIVQATGRLKDKWTAADPQTRTIGIQKTIPSIFNTEKITTAKGNFSREAADRIYTALSHGAQSVKDALLTPRIGRLSDEALAAGKLAQTEQIKRMFNKVNDAILDIDYVSTEPSVAGTYEFSVKMGRPDGGLFISRAEAFGWADRHYGLKDGDYRIRQQGAYYYLDLTRTLDETQDAVRYSQELSTKGPPSGPLGQFFGWGRSADDLTDEFQRGQKKLAQGVANEMQRYAKEVAKDFDTLPKKNRNRLADMLKADGEYHDPNDPKVRGRFAQTVEEFETNYRQQFKTAPTEAEARGYFQIVQLNDFDWAVRNFGVYRDKARHGVMKYSFRTKGLDDAGNMSDIPTMSFEAKRSQLPDWHAKDPFTVLVNDDFNGPKLIKSTTATDADKALVKKLIEEQGHETLEAYQALMFRTFEKITGVPDPVNFVVTKNYTETRLPWEQLPYKPGGHKINVTPYFVKQPKIVKGVDDASVFQGDRAVFGFETHAEAIKYSKSMEEGRRIINEGGDLRGFLAKNLPFREDEFRQFFEPKFNEAGEEVEALFDKDQPFVDVRSGRKTVDDHRDIRFSEDGTRSPYGNYTNFDQEFTSTRDPDLWTVKELGSEHNPVFNLESARTLDVYSTLNRSIRNIMSDFAMNDHRITSIESWAQRYKDIMTVTPEEFLRDPLNYLKNPPIDTNASNKTLVREAFNAARSTIDFLGTETETGKKIRWIQERVQDEIYGRLGQGASDFSSERLLPLVTDPSRWMRAVAFHSKLGLFNPVQFFLQAQSLVHVMAVAGPSHGFRGMTAGGMMQMLALTNDTKVIEAMAERAGRLIPGMSKDDFLESYRTLRETGIYNVEGEAAFRNDTTDPKMFSSKLGAFLDKGTMFFKGGERLVRLAAWNAAYSEWKLANPGKVIGSLDRARMVERADLMSVNMTRASNAAWQKGAFSVPTQFFAFQARLAEQMLGKRLTGDEWRRAFLTYSTMYGLPTGVGATFAVWPFYEDVRQAGLEQGMNMDNVVINALHNGIMSSLIEFMTGREYNIAQRLGPGGLSIFKDVYDGDKSTLELIFGASGTITGDMIKAMYPAMDTMASAIRGDGNYSKLLMSDLNDLAKNVSTYANAERLLMAANTGKYISKNGVYIGDIDTMDGLIGLFTGLSPIKISDTFLKMDIIKTEKTLKNGLKSDVVREAKKAWQAANDKDFELMQLHNYRVAGKVQAGNFSTKEKGDIWQETMKGNSLAETVDQQWLQREFRMRQGAQ